MIADFRDRFSFWSSILCRVQLLVSDYKVSRIVSEYVYVQTRGLDTVKCTPFQSSNWSSLQILASPLLELQNHIGAYYMRAPLLIQAFQVSHMRTTTCGLRLRIFVAYKYLYYVVWIYAYMYKTSRAISYDIVVMIQNRVM